MRYLLRAIAIALALTGSITLNTAHAQTPVTPQSALERIFTTDTASADWFTPAFLAQVPVTRIDTLVDTLTSSLGAYQRVEGSGSRFQVVFAKGTVPATIAIDNDGRISGLVFGAPQLADQSASVQQAVDSLNALPGKVSLLVLEDGAERANLHGEEPMAVGSAFKLAVLTGLRDQIIQGRHDWSDVVELKPDWKSLPSGSLQNWPDSAPLTIFSLAAEMISQSDNTAADALIDIVGRRKIEDLTTRNQPFLTTKEFFKLKDPANHDLLDFWRAGTEFERRKVLEDTKSRPLPTADIFSGSPVALDVEYFFSARELCGFMDHVADLPLMSINPGVAQRGDWSRIAYKGGSEPGVLNLTHWLESKSGKHYCVVATWNNSETSLDETKFTLLVGSLIGSLK